jgi:hypothetical protein
MTMVPYPYTAEDIERGFTVEHGRGGDTIRKPIPPAVWAASALGRIADALEEGVGQKAEIARLQKARVGVCASCGRSDRVVYFDREAMVCADFDDCWAACQVRDRNVG